MKRVAQAGGTTAQIQTYAGIDKQLVVNTENHRLYVMDGSTLGGFPLALQSDLTGLVSTASLNSTLEGYVTSGTLSSTLGGYVSTGIYNSGISGVIPKAGDAGTLTTMETIATAATVSDTSARSMSLAAGGTLTVNNGSANKAWITVVALQGAATINLGTSWSWSGSSPDLAKGLVTLAWYGSFGVANFQKFGE